LIPISIIIQAVAPIFIIAIAGLLMRRLKLLTADADASLLRMTINVLSPCLAFDSIVGNKALEKLSNLFIAPIIGYSTVAIGVALGLVLAKLLRFDEPKIRRTFAFTVGMYNYGYVPLPLALYLFDKETAGVLFVHNIGVEISLWTLGVALLSEDSKQINLKKIINAPLVSIVVSVILNFCGAGTWLPEVVTHTIKVLGQCAIPMGVILIGATIDDYLEEFNPGKGKLIISASCFLRLVVLPVIFLAIAYIIPCSKELKAVIVLQSAMPSAVFPIVMTKHYGGDVATALRVVISTSIVGFLTIPFWIQKGIKLLHLLN
jgi:predicted permease